MTILGKIVASGVSETDGYQERRSIVLSNYISLILCAAIIVIYLNRLFFLGDPSFENLLIGSVIFLSPILCNRFLSNTVSRLILCFVPILFIWYAFISEMQKMDSIEPSMYDGLRIYLLAVCFIPYLLFDKNKWGYLVAGITPTLVSFLFFNDLLTWTGVGSELFVLTEGDYRLMYMRTLVAYVIISGSCFTFQSIIIQNDKFNQQLLVELKSKTEGIETQNDKLVQSQVTLNEMNQHLEELVEQKAANIKRQNEMLIRYSFTNAHHVRGPVARILGPIQLSKMKTDLSYPWLFQKMEQETIQIDEIIKRISDDLSETTFDQE